MQAEQELAVLKKCMLFRNLADEEILSLVDSMSPRRVSYSKRTVVARDGEEFPQVGVILSGGVHLAHVDSSGNNNLVDTLGPGDSLGELAAVGGYRLHTDITATAETEILFLQVEPLLRRHLLTAPLQIRFLQNLTLAVARKGQYLTRKLEDSIRRTTRERLQDYLSAQYHKAGCRTFSSPLNRQDLADFLFVDRSAMSNELCRMRDEGLLRFEKSRFQLLVEMPITEEEPDPNDLPDPERGKHECPDYWPDGQGCPEEKGGKKTK